MAQRMLRDVIIETLQNEGAMLASFPGGIWDHIPRAGSGLEATPGAFWGPENPLEAGKLKNTISVLDGGVDPAPNGAARNGYVGFPLVYGYTIADTTGDAALMLLDERLHARFHRGISYARLDGTAIEFVVLESQPLRSGDEFGYPGRQFMIWRIQGTFIRP